MKKLSRKESRFTMAISLFSDIKRFRCRVSRSSFMSQGKRRSCCKASARYDACPRWDSHRVASHEIGAPSNSRRGDQVRCSVLIVASSRLSTNFVLFSLGSLHFFYCLAFSGSTSPSSSSSIGLFRLKLGRGVTLGQLWREEEEDAWM